MFLNIFMSEDLKIKYFSSKYDSFKESLFQTNAHCSDSLRHLVYQSSIIQIWRTDVEVHKYIFCEAACVSLIWGHQNQPKASNWQQSFSQFLIFPLSSFILVLTFQIAAAGLAGILEETDIPST